MATETAFTWRDSLDAGLAEAQATGKPVLLDFYSPT